jgi:hypothetical protein
MPIVCYLAMTGAEFSVCGQLPAHIGWMACHFSPSGPGLSNIPKDLPENSILLLDDSFPFHDHEPDCILEQLQQAISDLKIKAVILDFQREKDTAMQALVSLLHAKLPCPVVATPPYAKERMPVFLPPCPLHIPLEKHLAPYKGRQIWLDTTPLPLELTVTSQGTTYRTIQTVPCASKTHWDSTLYCNYGITMESDRIRFALHRDHVAFQKWISHAESLGITGIIGLYQEWK